MIDWWSLLRSKIYGASQSECEILQGHSQGHAHWNAARPHRKDFLIWQTKTQSSAKIADTNLIAAPPPSQQRARLYPLYSCLWNLYTSCRTAACICVQILQASRPPCCFSSRSRDWGHVFPDWLFRSVLAFVLALHMFSLQNNATQEQTQTQGNRRFDFLASACVFPCACVLSILTCVASAYKLVLASLLRPSENQA